MDRYLFFPSLILFLSKFFIDLKYQFPILNHDFLIYDTFFSIIQFGY